jgi:hypothetical protein
VGETPVGTDAGGGEPPAARSAGTTLSEAHEPTQLRSSRTTRLAGEEIEMKAIGLTQHGGPDVLRVLDLPVPVPVAGPGEVRIGVRPQPEPGIYHAETG